MACWWFIVVNKGYFGKKNITLSIKGILGRKPHENPEESLIVFQEEGGGWWKATPGNSSCRLEARQRTSGESPKIKYMHA